MKTLSIVMLLALGLNMTQASAATDCSKKIDKQFLDTYGYAKEVKDKYNDMNTYIMSADMWIDKMHRIDPDGSMEDMEELEDACGRHEFLISELRAKLLDLYNTSEVKIKSLRASAKKVGKYCKENADADDKKKTRKYHDSLKHIADAEFDLSAKNGSLNDKLNADFDEQESKAEQRCGSGLSLIDVLYP